MRFARKYFSLLFLFVLIVGTVSCSSEEPTPTAVALPQDTVVPEETDTAAAEATETSPPPTNTPAPPTATPVPNILNLDEDDFPQPYLIGRSPDVGEELALDGTFELYFDQPMNREATANALRVRDSDGNEVAGEVSWPQPRVMRFKPAVELAPDRSYEALLNETAASESGENLAEGLTLTFNTIGNLEVSQVSPVDLATEVQGDTAVTVIFNRPVVPLLTYEEQAELPNPLVFDPPIEGQGEWVNTSVFVFRADEAFVGRQTYNVRVVADVVNEASATGSALAADYQWSFTVTAPTINRLSLPGRESYPRDNYEHLPLDQDFEVYFNQPMNRASTEAAVSLASEGGQVPLQFAWNESNTMLAITPTVELELATRYVFSVSDSATSAEGGRLRAGLVWNAITALPPAIIDAEPADGTTQRDFLSYFTLYFASRMERESLEEKVIFDPPLATTPAEGYYSPWEWSLRFYGLQPSTTYTVRVLPGMSDPHGNIIDEESTYTFTTAAYDPTANLEMSGILALYRQGGSTAIWSSYRNVSELDVDLYAITPRQFHRIVNDREFGERTFAPPSSNEFRVWSQTVAVDAAENTRGYKRLELLSESGEELPAGFYYITLNADEVDYTTRHLAGRAILLANANITLKTTLTEAMIWVTDLETGAPLANVPVTFYNENFAEVFSGVTDADGLVYQGDLSLDPVYDSRYYAIADGEGVFGAAFNGWVDGTNPYDFGIYTDYYTEPDRPQTYVYTDRPLYRPGQNVEIKGVVRFNDDLDYALPDFETVYVNISSYDGQVFEGDVSLSEFGTFVISLELDDEATLGGYFIDIRTRESDGEYIGGGNFDVAEFRKPTYQVNVTAAETDVALGDTLRATIKAEYFSGGSVIGGEAYWNVSTAPYTFSGGPNLRTFSFDNNEYDRYYFGYFNQSPFGTYLTGGQGETDGKGEFVVQLPAEPTGDTAGSRTFTIEGTVNDVGGNSVSGRTQIIVHQSEVYAGIRSSARIGEAGEEVSFDVVLVDWDGEVQPNGTVSVEIVRRQWNSVQEEDENGNTIWRSEVEEIPAAEFEAVELDENGRATVTFIPEQGGVYRAYVRATDARGNDTVSSTYLWVSGGGYVSWRRSSDHGFDLIADSDSYAPGDTAEILIASPFQGDSYALVTTERGHIYSSEVIKLDSNSTIYRLPITGEMAPNIFISVMVMKGVDEFNTAPDFKMGMLQFNVEREEQELNIDITPSAELLGPQDTVTYTVRVTDHKGAPVEAELSLSLVDLALLSLKADNAPPILDYFYSTRWLSVQTAVLLTRNMDAYNQELQEEIKGGGGGGGDFGVITVREDFKDTAFWSGQLTTDENGVATVTVTLPDNLTTWRMDVRAVTKDTRVGQATNDIRTTRPLLVSPQTPRFFVRGDKAEVGTVVRNTTNQPLEVDVTMEADGVIVEEADTQVVTVPANNSVYVAWHIEVTDVERVDFVFAANSGEYADAARPEIATLEGGGIPVYRYEVPETVGTSGQMLEGGVFVESLGLPIYPDFEFTEGELTVEVAPSLAAAMTDGLDYLKHYPYECTEQIVSKFLPNVITTRALSEAGLSDPALEASLETQVNIALQRLYGRQNADGGWPWWSGDRSNTLVSAYVVLGLLEADRADYPIEPRALRQGAQYIYNNLENVDEMNGRFKFNRQAFLVYVLARVGNFNVNSFVDELFDNREALDLYARSYLAQAMLELAPDDPRIETLVADMISSAAISATGAHWDEEARDYWNWNTDTRSTGIILSLMAKTEPENPITAQAVRWLMNHRDGGYWRGTQETAWVLMGLTDWMVESGELEADYLYEVALNGNLLGQGEATAETLRSPLQVQADITELLTGELNRLAIGRTDGPGNLYYTAHMRTTLPVEEVSALDKGIVISRAYFDPADRTTPVTAAEQGDTVVVRLTIVVPNSLHYVVIDDPLPAGLEAIDLSLRTSEIVGAPDRYLIEESDFGYSGWGWWYFDHVELRDEKVVISANYMPAGTYEYVYLARASSIGEYKTIPPSAFEFYFPEVYGRGDGSIFEVVSQGTLPDVVPPTEEATNPEDETTAEETASSTSEAEDIPLVDTFEIGRSVNDNPITAVRIGNGEQAIVLVGGIHAGFAPASVTLAEELAAELEADPELVPDNISLYIVLNANPDSADTPGELSGRFNANGVDLNRNWDCLWAADTTIIGQVVEGAGGSEPFSEPETAALSDWLLELDPEAVVFWQARAADGLVAAGGCDSDPQVSGPLAERYSTAAGYELDDFEALTQQPLNGDATNWLDAQGIPAISVLLPDYDEADFENNRQALLELLAFYAAQASQATRVQFAEGGTSARFEGVLEAGEVAEFVMQAAAGQIVLAGVYTSAFDENDPYLQITGVEDGAVLVADNEQLHRWYGGLAETQDYRIQVIAGEEAADYNFYVAVPERIQFATGATSATIEGVATDGATNYYIFQAAEGQTLTVTSSAAELIYFTVTDFEDEHLLIDATLAPDELWSKELPATQEYLILIAAPDERVPYRLDVQIE